MLAPWRGGFDVVYGVRNTRKEHALKKGAYDVFYGILHFLSEGLIPKHSGDFGLVDRRVVLAVRSMGERIQFLSRSTGLGWFLPERARLRPQSPRRRRAKYTFRKLYSLATDGIISSSIRPLKIAEWSAFALLAAAAGSLA